MTSPPSTSESNPSIPSSSRDPVAYPNLRPQPESQTSDPGPVTEKSNPIPAKATGLPRFASPQYMEQYQNLLERQRQLFDEERALWLTEKQHLLKRIDTLESTLSSLQFTPKAELGGSSSSFDAKPPAFQSSSWSTSATDGSRHGSSTSTGDEVWRGSSAKGPPPTRAFPESSVSSGSKSGQRLPSIAEDEQTTRGRRSFLSNDPAMQQTSLRSTGHKTSIPGSQLSESLDGINFKSSGLPSAVVQQLHKDSPNRKSPADLSPNTIDNSSKGIELPEEIDPFTKDAGHTPLARHGGQKTRPGASNPSSTSGDAPNPAASDSQRPPLEQRPTVLKVPSEDQKSYFPDTLAGDPAFRKESQEKPPLSEQENRPRFPTQAEDPALQGPLGLTNDKDSDGAFLSEVDSKLAAAADAAANAKSPDSEATLSPPPSGSSTTRTLEPYPTKTDEHAQKENAKLKDTADAGLSTPPAHVSEAGSQAGNKIESPEAEPKLRFKRSMNFGSAFGEYKGM